MKLRKLKRKRTGNAKKSHQPGQDTTEFDRLVTLAFRYAQEGDMKKEEKCYHKMLKISPDNADVLNHLGNIQAQQCRFDEAIDSFNQALINKPDDLGTHVNISKILTKSGRTEEAIAHLRTAIAAHPDQYTLFSAYLFDLNYLPSGSESFYYTEALKWWDTFGNTFFGRPFEHQKRQHTSPRLRIGYVSPDFKTHSVSYFFLPVVQHHNRDRFEIYCYSDVAKPDAVTKQIQNLSDIWRPSTGKSYLELARTIHDDRIDILVDLAGHTQDNRLAVFALKPAPIQVSWLGYPNTTGLKSIDYRLTDEIADPPGDADQSHTESLVRLPHGFLCYSPPSSVPEPQKNRSTTGSITFGSFNNFNKVNEQTIALWAQIMAEVPDSSFLIKAKSLADLSVKQRVIDIFGQHGIKAERLIIKPWAATTMDHFALYKKMDIGLDTHPYNGTTTTCEALWMNTPVVTLSGERHAARVGASILKRVGCEELIASSPEEYVAIATHVAGDMLKGNSPYGNMRQRMKESGLCNPTLFCEQLESVYLKMSRDLIGQVCHN